LLPIKYRYETVGEKEEIVPGIKFILTPGHSPGEMVLVIRSGNEQIYCLGDLIHHLKEFDRPDYYSGADISPNQAIASRNRIFSSAAKTGDLVFAGHLPFPGLGHIGHNGDLFSWEPIKIEA
jgi:glyoxylase-like metal-dependent hydrolase (beta-lactamase superfamily II)